MLSQIKANIQTYKNGIDYLKKLKYPKWFCLLHLNGNEYDSKIRAEINTLFH